MGNGLTRASLWVLVVVVLASTLAAIPGAQAGSTPNTLQGYVYQTGGASAPPVPAGVTVDLQSAATHQTYSTTTASASGQFTFTQSSTANSLTPGWYGLWVPPQAHASLYGCKPCAVLPSDQNPQNVWESQTSLTSNTNPVSLSGVQLIPYNGSLWGNVTYNGQPAAGAQVWLLAPTFNNFILANNTTVSAATNTTVVGEYSLQVPWGTWVLETVVPGSPNHYNFDQIVVNATHTTVNPIVGNFLTWGFVDQAANPSAPVPNGGNVTVFDPSNGYIYSSVTPQGGYYNVGTYPAAFTGPGPQTFNVVLSPVGYQTVSYTMTVSAGNPSGGSNPHNVVSAPIAPAAVYWTTLNFASGFGKVAVTTNASLGSNSVLPELANASVGQLWAQLALDWQHNLSFNHANLPTFVSWVNSSGPFFAAGQSALTVNGTGFGQPTNFTLASSSTCAGYCNVTSNAKLNLNWSQSYNVTAALPTNNKSYALGFTFRHPTNDQAFNYTIVLPSGYVLSSGAAAPAQTKLLPAGPGGTWTSFTLASLPSANPSGTASFTIVRYATITANVNVTSSNFTFSTANVLNSTHGNYTAIVGVGENVTFSGLNSTFPAGSNGTLYAWNFGDGGSMNTSQPTTYHIYTSASDFVGSLTVTSSGGLTSTVAFNIYADNLAPVAQISVNSTVLTAGSASYVLVKWGSTLHFNASSSTDSINGVAPVKGVLSIASWNISSTKYAVTANYTTGTGAKVGSNLTLTFLGAGNYLTAANLGGSSVTFTGWQYNVSLMVWDGAGHLATATMYVLVNDTEKPTPVIQLLDSAGRSVASSGVVEGAGHNATVQLSAVNSTDPHNGSIVNYQWNITNSGNSSANQSFSESTVAPFKAPTFPKVTLDPQVKPYTVNLTVTDRAGNTAYVTASLTVAVNTSQRPVLSVTNLTAPSSMTDGTSYTIWANVTNTIGQNSTALGVQVVFYLLAQSGSGGQTNIGGSPGSVQFYNYTTNTTVSSVAWPSPVNLAYNHTVRAVIHWNPSQTGNWALWANATATNEFVSDYKSGGNQAQVSVSLNQNPIVNIEYAAVIIVVAAVLIVLAVILYRRRSGGGKTSKSVKGWSSGKSGDKGKDKEKDKKAEDDDE